MTEYLVTEAHRTRAEQLVRAERDRIAATHEAEVEYSETVAKLRECFEADLADALRQYLVSVRPVHRAYHAATVCAEWAFVEAQRI